MSNTPLSPGRIIALRESPRYPPRRRSSTSSTLQFALRFFANLDIPRGIVYIECEALASRMYGYSR